MIANSRKEKNRDLLIDFILSLLKISFSVALLAYVSAGRSSDIEFSSDKSKSFIFSELNKQSEEWIKQSFLPENVKEEINKWVNFSKYLPRYLVEGKKSKTNHFLFWGPPGTGKTHAAELFSQNEAIAYAFVDFGSEVFVGSSKVKRNKIIKQAKKILTTHRKVNLPVVIIVDEIDSIGTKNIHNHSSKEEVNGLLTFIDEVVQSRLNIIIIGITNYPEILEEALVRPGRLGNQIKFDYLTDKEIEGIISYLKKKEVAGKGEYKQKNNKTKQNNYFVEWTDNYWEEIKVITKEKNGQEQSNLTFVVVEEAINKSLEHEISKKSQKIIPRSEIYKKELEKTIENRNAIRKKNTFQLPF